MVRSDRRASVEGALRKTVITPVHSADTVRKGCEENDMVLVHLSPSGLDLNPIEMIGRMLEKGTTNGA